jgi:hypothetical protein
MPMISCSNRVVAVGPLVEWLSVTGAAGEILSSAAPVLIFIDKEANSLNLAIATGIMVYELFNQSRLNNNLC